MSTTKSKYHLRLVIWQGSDNGVWWITQSSVGQNEVHGPASQGYGRKYRDLTVLSGRR